MLNLEEAFQERFAELRAKNFQRLLDGPVPGEAVLQQLVAERGSAAQIARDTGIKPATISHAVRGRRWLSREAALRIENAYGVEAELLMFRDKGEELKTLRSKAD